ncbi:MAG: hypothetical protein HWN67_21020 [Candidatus Helarchaeota archaeon]|nr:hypothetical protein [Candidatus Helarchaeota archaeon]
MIEGWEISSDRVSVFAKLMSDYPIEEPIITSKCKIDNNYGFLIVSDNGFAWRKHGAFGTSFYDVGKSYWIRWHDVTNIIEKKKGQIIIEILKREVGNFIVDKEGNLEIKKWKLTVNQNKNEEKSHWKHREEKFYNIMLEIYNKNKVEKTPLISDSVM